MMIGFGSTETAFEAAEEEAFKDYVEQLYQDMGLDWFEDEFTEAVQKWFKNRAAAYQAEAKRFKESENPPERYASIYPHVLSDGQYIVAVITFHHINRRHALSPDGWALMKTEQAFHVRKIDLDMARRKEGTAA